MTLIDDGVNVCNLHLTPVYISFGSFLRRASLRTTGYLPAFVGSTIPAIVAGVVVLLFDKEYSMKYQDGRLFNWGIDVIEAE